MRLMFVFFLLCYSNLTSSFDSCLDRPSLIHLTCLLIVPFYLLYSVYIVRVDRLTSRAQSALPLAESQIFSQLGYATAWSSIFALSGDLTIPNYLQHSLTSMSTQDFFVTLLGILWIGVGTNAIATWIRMLGQQRVGASRSAIFYASQPVWAAALSAASGLDSLTLNEILGGFFIFGGSLLLAAVDHYNARAASHTQKESI